MTTVAFFSDGERLWGFSAQGHSGYADAGADIVCAAISALCQTAEMGIREIARCSAETRVDKRIPSFELRLRGNDPESDSRAQIILRTLEMGICDIAQQYSGFVTTTYRKRRQTS